MKAAQKQAYNRIDNIMIPNMYYRKDIGDRWFEDFRPAAHLGLFAPVEEPVRGVGVHDAFVDQLAIYPGIVPIRGFTFSAPLGASATARP